MTDAVPPAPRFGRRLPLVLGFLQAVGPMSTDMYLPGFPAIEAGFHTMPGSAQYTLAAWVLGLSFGQLGQGVLSDRFGRRAPLLFGTALYTLATACCALAPSLPALTAWRFVAALGASASMIVPRAVVRDVAEGRAAARLMSRLILILGAAPILAPSLGGFVLPHAGWRGIFWIMTLYGALGFTLAARFLPDTLPRARRIRLDAAAIAGRFGRILRERCFLTHALMLSAVAFALFAYLGGSPAAFIGQYALSPGHYAIAFGAVAATYILCSQLNIRLTDRWGLDRTLRRVSALYLALAILLAAVTWTGAGGLAVFAVVLAVTQGLTGFLNPTATVGALQRHATHAGSASAVLGTLQFLLGALGGLFVGLFADGTARPMAALVLLGAIAAKIADRARPRGEGI